MRAHQRGTPLIVQCTAHSGAGVFDAGTIAWACAVNGRCGYPVSGVTVRVVRAATANVLRAFAVGPAGWQHPAVDNLTDVGILHNLH